MVITERKLFERFFNTKYNKTGGKICWRKENFNAVKELQLKYIYLVLFYFKILSLLTFLLFTITPFVGVSFPCSNFRKINLAGRGSSLD
jgi:hypothetical protein